METRYYFIFAIVVIVLQCLLAIFNRTLRWLWVDKHCPQSKKWLTLALFTASNAVLFCECNLGFTSALNHFAFANAFLYPFVNSLKISKKRSKRLVLSVN